MAKVAGNKYRPGDEKHQRGEGSKGSNKFSKNAGASMNKSDNAKLGDIYTSAKSTMEAASYERGYPPNEIEFTNAMPAIIRGKSKG